jgi:purine-binding chemotaxis protein CheW
MVDLVKIRKKAKQKKEEELAASAEERDRGTSPPALPGSGDGVLRRASPAQNDTGNGGSAASAAPREAGSPAEVPPALPGSGDGVLRRASPAQDDTEIAAAPLSASPTEVSRDLRAIERLERFKEEVGRKREGMTAKKEGEGERSNEIELFTFLIAGEQYAVDIDRIVGIVTPRPVTRVPNSDPSVLGIMSLRGTIVTLLDIRRRLAHPARTSVPDSHIVVIEQRGETLGFQVDRVLRVVKMAPDELEPHPVVHSSEQSESIMGVFHQGGSLTILLDLERLLSQ